MSGRDDSVDHLSCALLLMVARQDGDRAVSLEVLFYTIFCFLLIVVTKTVTLYHIICQVALKITCQYISSFSVYSDEQLNYFEITPESHVSMLKI